MAAVDWLQQQMPDDPTTRLPEPEIRRNLLGVDKGPQPPLPLQQSTTQQPHPSTQFDAPRSHQSACRQIRQIDCSRTSPAYGMHMWHNRKVSLQATHNHVRRKTHCYKGIGKLWWIRSSQNRIFKSSSTTTNGCEALICNRIINCSG